VVQRGPTPGPNNLLDQDGIARTVINQGPLGDRRPAPPTTDPYREPVTDTRPVNQQQPAPKPSTPPPAPALSADALFSDLGDEPEKTRIIQGSRRALPPVSELPTDPRRAAAKRPGSGGSRAGVFVGAVVALALGAAGGILLFKRMQAPVPKVEPTKLGRVSLKSDRPADVLFNGQLLGTTPTTAFVPAGHHSLQLKEPDGTVRLLAVEVKPGEEANVVVTLDSLEKLP
jgi:hypothetical protein